ncbi:MAG: type III pantothenate kinase, partial [Rhodocyclaceae bacterium]
MILCLDAGNTRLKWGVREGAVWRAQGACAHADCGGLATALPAGIERILACNVAGAEVARRIEALAS